ncbi:MULTISPECIES: efflux RND transporter permease subunit [unclassified Polaromonas]|jgi:multidrug efflux pump|uniref:efflux RND transporter permease subunit n=1 Tax=unclassified Polaromonas TaxID=2638319 RepID=UPI000BCA2F94|nr:MULTISPECIES: efflux RND transporter permease subunit [unclassified Polaromonas]OYY36995.1 MAG: multidrug transporter AcrB [Polaromonas sp. 35-63-35]OYZ20615.1 MAG: multidrug transporter AcrB [Polaromonas sp. 16-63-31]OYZ78754.1 MAG: multidrug transporter AcrB [Polaromonas sp. 24-63-21]OZA49733.1 MAG: multidrug transporter AcrB [Polaromonas sp. 17-63-33]OZA89097.1 MAG: multidrug transporter AcrB [Polaromonas sp. 39-63-25]
MQLAEVSIRRPVFATVLSLLIVLVGAVSFQRLAVREYPKIDEPVVTVSVRYPGASAEVIESQVTKPLEDSIAGIDAVDVLTSISRADQSQISVRFRLEKDADAAAAEVRDRTSRVRNKLPQSIEEPVIAKVEADAFPVIWLAFTSDSLTRLQINDLVNRIVKPRLQTVTGVADVRIFGERKYAMRVWLDPRKMAAYRLTTQDIEDAIRRSNLEVPAGRIESQQREFSVTSETGLVRPEQFGEVVIRSVNGFPVKVRDVARVEEGAADERSGVRLNGRAAIGAGVIRQATANPLDLSQGVRNMIPQLKADLPPEVNIDIANDNSVFIDRSVRNVYTTIAEAVALVALVIFVFLRTFRASIIPIITIPVSLIGTFALMALASFTINTLTLLALVLAIGLVVDDAIVMLENIFRHIEEGLDPFSAAIKGAREIGFAVVTMTATLVAVYAPLAFTPGRTGRLFVEFALALAGAVVVSGFVALTLTPMLCAKLLKHNPAPNVFDRGMESFLNAVSDRYASVLRWVLTRRYQPVAGQGGGVKAWVLQARWIVVGVMLASALAILLIFPTMKQELSPLEDRGTILATVNAPDGATLDYTNRYAQALEKMGQPYKEFDRIFASVGNPTVSQASVIYRTVDWDERKRSTLEMARELQPKFASLPGVTAFPITPPSLGQGFRERPLNFVIQTSDSYENLDRVVEQILAEVAKNPGIQSPVSDLRLNKPELRIDVNRDKAADLGVSVEVVAKAIETMLGGRNVTRYKRDAEQYDVIVQTEASGRSTPEDIEGIYVRGRNDAMIPLSSLVTVREAVSPRELNHFGQRRAASITANLAPDYSLGQALTFMNATSARVLKPGYSTDLNGTSREFKNSQGALAIVFVLALVFIFLVLAAQFESFIDPLVIMLSVPLSMIGALIALKLSGGSLNVYSQIGLITLVGLITKHGILIVEFTNQLRGQGMDMLEALVKASAQRLRPILMTTGAMVLGALPLALATGAGAESRIQIGWVIVGGMSLGTLLTVFVVPTMYALFARSKIPGANKAVAKELPADVHGELIAK